MTDSTVNHQVVLETLDGGSYQVECPPETTVLDAAATAGIILPSLCGQGTCGACEAKVTEGSCSMGSHDPQLLGKRAAGGAVLLCRTTPESAATIALPYDQTRVLESNPVPRDATIAEVSVVAHGTFKLVLQLGPDEFGSTAAEFEPGQFVQLQVPGRADLRAYSMANSGNWDGVLEFFIRFHEGGFFSDYLANRAEVGNKLIVHGPQGAFHAVENGLRPRWFVSGGTGVAPLLSMVRRMAEWADPHAVRVFHGVNRMDEVFAVPELAEAGGALMGGFDLTVCVRDGGDGVATGTPVDALAAALPCEGEQPDIYVCGPPGMVTAVEDLALSRGVPENQVYVEHFVAT